MLLAMDSLEAEDLLKSRAESMTADQIFDETLRATGSRAQAERAMTARLKAELRSGQRPAGS